MFRLVSVTSIALLSVAAPVLAQSNMGVDTNGRFDGSPPPGTSPEYDAQQSGFEIPLDPIVTGGVTIGRPSSWQLPCAPQRGGTRSRGDGSVNAACPDRSN